MIIALAAGIADGLGYGDNTKAALITRALPKYQGLARKWAVNFRPFAAYPESEI